MLKKWKYTLRISDTFHDDSQSLRDKTTAIVSRIKDMPWVDELEDRYRDELDSVLEELTDAADEDDVEWWDACWSNVYDILDAERVWVVTR